MGIVYSALDTRLGRTVALKVLPPEKSRDPKRRKRFLREARTAAALNHPNIVCIYDIGSDQGNDFIAMELVTGLSLDAMMKRGLAPVPDVLSYAFQTALALARAHAAGVVHRDVKPSNIMITEEGSVKLLDFGLAQLNPVLAAGEEETASAITELGAALGTLQYMSPEQARGEHVDERSDIFSFGAVLYEMAAGAKPFRAASTFAVLQAIAYAQPKPIGECRDGGIPPQLCAIISKCLQKDREARYQSMQAVADELGSVPGRRLDTSAQSGWVLPAAAPKYNWKPLVWIAGGLLAAALLFGLSPYGRRSWHQFRSSGQLSSILPVEAAEWRRRGHAYLLRYDKAGNVDHAIECFQKALEEDHDNAAAYAGLGEAYAQKYAENRDPQLLRQARSHASRALQLNDLLAGAHVSMGTVNIRAGQFQDAERELRRAVELEPKNADGQLRLAESLAAQNRAKDAEAGYRKLIQTDPNDWRAYHFLGALLFDNGRYEDAIASFQKAIQLAPDNPAIYRIMGVAYHRLDRDPEAAETLQKALAIRPTPYVLTNLGTVYYYEGRYLDAVSAYERAITNGANDYSIWGNLGDAYRFTAGNQAKATEAYGHAIQLVREQLSAGPDSPELRSRLATFLAKTGEKQRAMEAIRQCENSPKLDPTSMFHLGIASELCGRRDAALEWLGKAVKAGFGMKEIQNDPDLVALRRDPGYHRLVVSRIAP